MKAEISNLGLYGERRFSGLYQQQGRMLVDRDWNELCDILRRLGTAIGSEAIGTGVPRHDGLLVNPNPPDPVLLLRNSGGLVAAGGLIGEVLPRRPANDPSLYRNQTDLPQSVRASGTNAEQPLLKGSADGRLLYIDLWERPVTAFEIADLVDPALHGADTCLRTQRMAQIKVAAIDDLDKAADPCLPRFLPGRIPGKGNAVFDAKLTPADEASDPCDPCAEQVVIARSVDNALFRLEVHSVGFDAKRRPNQLVLKWSGDNGARELRLTDFAALADPTGHSYEYFSDKTEPLLGMPSDDWVDEEYLRGVIDPIDASKISGVLPRIREWDGWCVLKRAGAAWSVGDGRYLGKQLGAAGIRARLAIAADTLAVDLIDRGLSLTLTLADQNFVAGDFWLALLRNRAPANKRVSVISATPLGIEHRYCILGTGAVSGSDVAFKGLSPFDLRRLQHPSLTCLDASDIGYATDCPSGLFDASHDTVKKALDQICRIRADQVAFALPCTTSVYSHANAATFHTVADALKLLCDVDADQIGFTPGCGYLKGPGIDTVQEALDALCNQPAETIPFTPTCKFLKDANATDVAAALNALCNRGDGKQDLPFIKAVSWTNDQSMPLSQFGKGLIVSFSEPMLTTLITSDVFIVTWELAFANQFEALDLLTPQILLGDVTKSADGSIKFGPRTQITADKFKAIVAAVQSRKPDFPGIRCRVRLPGRSIFAEKGNRPLDGHVPMVPNGTQIDLDFKNPGMGRVSDFESWFYVVEG